MGNFGARAQQRARPRSWSSTHSPLAPSQAMHVMLPNVSTQFLRSFASRAELGNFVTTFIPPFQINLEVEFMLQRNQAVNSFGWMVRVPVPPLPPPRRAWLGVGAWRRS